MIDETLRKMEERIRSSSRTSDEAKRDLLALLDELRSELAEVPAKDADEAGSIVAQAASALENAEDGVEDSVRGFETAHPRIAGLLQSFLRTLSDAGI